MTTHRVREFMEKYGFPINVQLEETTDLSRGMLTEVCRELHRHSIELRSVNRGDVRLDRMSLLLEEVSELAHALAIVDRVAVADALGDIDYIVRGTFVTYDIPQIAVHEEVHRSNMTKTIGGLKPGKNVEYDAPRLGELLEGWDAR